MLKHQFESHLKEYLGGSHHLLSLLSTKTSQSNTGFLSYVSPACGLTALSQLNRDETRPQTYIDHDRDEYKNQESDRRRENGKNGRLTKQKRNKRKS